MFAIAAQLASIANGDTYASYKKTLEFLGLNRVPQCQFDDLLAMLYPAIEYLLDDVTKLSRDEIKSLDSSILGSWKQTVLTAGGAWMTHGFHLKNFTFSVRNYFTGALLYYKHICQRGRDTVIKDGLYPGTSKSMEGHAARVLYQ